MLLGSDGIKGGSGGVWAPVLLMGAAAWDAEGVRGWVLAGAAAAAACGAAGVRACTLALALTDGIVSVGGRGGDARPDPRDASAAPTSPNPASCTTTCTDSDPVGADCLSPSLPMVLEREGIRDRCLLILRLVPPSDDCAAACSPAVSSWMASPVNRRGANVRCFASARPPPTTPPTIAVSTPFGVIAVTPLLDPGPLAASPPAPAAPAAGAAAPLPDLRVGLRPSSSCKILLSAAADTGGTCVVSAAPCANGPRDDLLNCAEDLRAFVGLVIDAGVLGGLADRPPVALGSRLFANWLRRDNDIGPAPRVVQGVGGTASAERAAAAAAAARGLMEARRRMLRRRLVCSTVLYTHTHHTHTHTHTHHTHYTHTYIYRPFSALCNNPTKTSMDTHTHTHVNPYTHLTLPGVTRSATLPAVTAIPGSVSTRPLSVTLTLS